MKHGQAVPVLALWLVGVLAVLWGASWPFMKLVLSEMEPLRFRSFGSGVGSLGLFLIAWMTGARIAVPRDAWLRLISMSFFNMAAWTVLMIYGLAYLEASRAVILAYTFPVWTVPLNAWLMRERLTGRRLTGLVLGVAGLALLLGDELFSLGRSPLGALLLVGSAISWAIGTVVMKRWPVTLPAISLTAWQSAIAWVPLTALGLAFESGPLQPFGLSAGPLIGALYNAFVSAILCQWAWYKLVVVTSASVSSLSSLAVPVMGVFLSILLLGERPALTDLAALVLVVSSLAVVLLAPRALASRG